MVKLHLDPQRLPVDAIAGEAALPPERLRADWLRERLAHPPAWIPELPNDLRDRFPRLRRAAVLAQVTGEPITLFSVADSAAGKPAAEEAVANARALLEALQIPVVETKTAIGNPVEEIVERGSLYKAIVVTDEGRTRLLDMGAEVKVEQKGEFLLLFHGGGWTAGLDEQQRLAELRADAAARARLNLRFGQQLATPALPSQS